MNKYIIIVIMLLSGCVWANAGGRDPQKGYRGFVESESFFVPNFAFIFGDGGSSDFWSGMSTVHGYQLNPHLFIGAGMSCVWMFNDADDMSEGTEIKYLPLFADVRTDWRFGRFTPFADLRIGWNLLRHGSFSGALTIGYRFNWGRRVSLNLALGVNMRGYRCEEYQSGWLPDSGPWVRPTGTFRTAYDVMPVLRVGIDF